MRVTCCAAFAHRRHCGLAVLHIDRHASVWFISCVSNPQS